MMEITVEGGKSKKLLTGGKYCPEDIVVTAEKPVEVEEKDVNFYDYDGTLLYSYAIAEAQALTELPPGPTHEGLVFQDWNWSLEDVKALDQFMVIGANYITDDGKTRLYISIDYNQHLTVPLYINQSVSGGVEIDWGDGSAIETISGTGKVNTTHTYAYLGEYVIRLTAKSGTLSFDSDSGVFGTARQTLLRKLELGGGLTSSPYSIGNNAFLRQRLLKTATIPTGLKGIGLDVFNRCNALSGAIAFPQGINHNNGVGGIFYECTSLEIVSFPKSQKGIPNGVLRECRALKYAALYTGHSDGYGLFNYSLENNRSLKKVEIPDSENLSTCALNGCTSLAEFTVKSSVSNIGASAIRDCASLVVLRFLPTTPPTVANANAFSGIPTTCRVEVPAESLTEYQNATNYSGIAAQMVGV